MRKNVNIAKIKLQMEEYMNIARIQTGYDIQVIIASVDKKCNVTNWYGYDCEIKEV